jgi:acetyl-CoA carboxylase biotin carboxyl carrier protein
MAAGRRDRATPDKDPIERIRELASLLEDHRLTAVSARWNDVSVRLERLPGPAPAPPPARPHAMGPAEPLPSPASTSPAVTIESPMVGTFYAAPSPGADPFVREGDRVKAGQVLCVIEAMKLMNEIEAKLDGTILKVLVENGAAVEYGQPLFQIEPLA